MALPAIDDGFVEQLKVIDELEVRIQVNEIMLRKISGCVATYRMVGTSRGELMISRINRPAGFEPANSPIHAANEIEIKAAPYLVWRRLVEAPRWQEYYPHASEIHLPAGEDALRSGIQFTWVTAEKKLVTTVKEYVPNERIAWEVVLADDASSSAYHAWLITPTDCGCDVRIEETQQGPFWVELAKKMPDGLHHFHQDWVEKLAEVAETDAAKTS